MRATTQDLRANIETLSKDSIRLEINHKMLRACNGAEHVGVSLVLNLDGSQEEAIQFSWHWTMPDEVTVHYFSTSISYLKFKELISFYVHPLPRIGIITIHSYIDDVLKYATECIQKRINRG